jgi:hypothetical protein
MARGRDVEIDTSGSRDQSRGNDRTQPQVDNPKDGPPPSEPKVTGR